MVFEHGYSIVLPLLPYLRHPFPSTPTQFFLMLLLNNFVKCVTVYECFRLCIKIWACILPLQRHKNIFDRTTYTWYEITKLRTKSSGKHVEEISPAVRNFQIALSPVIYTAFSEASIKA